MISCSESKGLELGCLWFNPQSLDIFIMKECKLLSGPFATSLQICIGISASSTLLYKRYIEHPKRPWNIWMMDVSKQGFSSVLMHAWNIFQSILFSALSTRSSPDECANYFINFLLDTLFGVFIIWAGLSLICRLARIVRVDCLMENGFYGDPPQISWYFAQLGVFLLVIIMSKLLLGSLLYLVSSTSDKLAEIVFRPLRSNPELELVIVMVVCPFFLSIIQVIIIISSNLS